jgi:hypothetical protein
VTRGGPWPHVGLAAVAIAAAAVVADPAPRVQEAFSFADRDIDESSGLALENGLVLTVNDSGGDPVVYAVDPATGETVGRTTFTSGEVEDVEALAVGPDGTVWVADIGDNGAERDAVAVYAVPPVGRGDRTVDAPRYELTYPGGARDAETLLADPRDGRLYVVSKGLFGGTVFAAPKRLQEDATNRLRRVADVDGLLTDGTFTADGSHALLRGYGRLYVADTDTWRYPAEMPLPDQRQGEGLALDDEPGKVLVSSEGARTTVMVVPLTEPVRNALADARPDDKPERPLAVDDPGPPVREAVGLAVTGVVGTLALVAVGLWVRGARRRSRSMR